MSTHLRFSGLAIGLLLLIASGCGDDPIVSNDGGGAEPETNQETVDFPEFREEADSLLAAQCETMISCCGTDGLESAFGFEASDVDECVEKQQGMFGGLGTAVMENSYNEGRIEFNEGMVGACAESLRAVPCSEFQGTEEERKTLGGCAEVVKGLVSSGGTCTGDWECTGEMVCVFNEDDTSGEGTCQDRPDIGESCADRSCGDFSYCDPFETVCVEGRPDGEPCSEHRECISGNCGRIEQSDGSNIRECMDPAPVCS